MKKSAHFMWTPSAPEGLSRGHNVKPSCILDAEFCLFVCLSPILNHHRTIFSTVYRHSGVCLSPMFIISKPQIISFILWGCSQTVKLFMFIYLSMLLKISPLKGVWICGSAVGGIKTSLKSLVFMYVNCKGEEKASKLCWQDIAVN